jgi:hypothetical protein
MASLLAYRPVHALHRLPRGSRACPLSLRHVLAAPGLPRGPIPSILAPTAPVLRGALAAAREARAIAILRCPRELDAAAWFPLAARAAEEVAPGHPFVAAAELAVAGADPASAERAALDAAALVDAGLGHLALDATAIPAPERARAAAGAGAVATERELGLELVLDPAESTRPDRAAAAVAALRLRGIPVDLVRAAFVAPADDADAKAQARALLLLARQATVGVARAGPTTPGLLALLAASPVRACDDAGAVLRAALRARGDDARAEALAWSEAGAFVEALAAAGSAPALAARFGEEG